MKKKIAVVGIQGVPANYGGFETMVENIIGENCSEGTEYTVFCSAKDMAKTSDMIEYKGAKLRYIKSFKANGAQSTIYDIVSFCKCLGKDYDVILVLGVSGCIFLPIYRLICRKKIIINIDGLEHRRGKWGKWAKRFLKFSEKMAIKYADTIITDNKGIQDYVKEEYGKDSEMIAYGGDHVLCEVSNEKVQEILNQYQLIPNDYSFSVCRIEPENNVHVTLEAFEKAQKNLVFVGNWEKSEYGRTLLDKYKNSAYVKLLSPIYDLETLNVFRSNCSCYIHGHSAGGTNPSLVEAMFFGKPILAYDVVYNRETTNNKAYYFDTSDTLVALLQRKDLDGTPMKNIGSIQYTWKRIAKQYESLY